MIKRLFVSFFLLISVCASAQYTEVINSNRPGFSESPYSVGQNVYQFESSLFFRKADAIPTFSNPQALGLNLHIRTGLFTEKLELSLTTALQNDKLAFKNVFESSYNKTGLSQLTLGAKYLVFRPKYDKKSKEIRSWKKRHSFDFKRWIPHVSAYAGVNFGSILSDYHERGGITPKIGILLQNEFSNKLNLVTNIYYNYIGGYLPEWSFILTETYNFNDYWSGFVEYQALFNEVEKQSNLGLGAAYLFSNNLQINASLKATLQEETVGMYTSIGVSYRIDNHKDKFIELDEFGNKVESIEKKTYNKGFFGRLFDKIGGVFKKKDKPNPKVDLDISKPQPEDGKETGRGRKRQKSILDDITKADKKDKKKVSKAEKKAAKKKSKAEEKALRKLEKEKIKEEKNKKKEQEKLEKDIKKLEKELKEEEEKAKQDELDKKYQEEKKKQEEEKKKQENNKKNDG
ncbi:transporter [Tenacibaculum adriaticum]|nr:transporter [Tenacibaculum adriaticum]